MASGCRSWSAYSSALQAAMARNDNLLTGLVQQLPKPEERVGFAEVDWVRACVLLCVAAPDLHRIGDPRSTAGVPALQWLVDSARDVAEVLGHVHLPDPGS